MNESIFKLYPTVKQSALERVLEDKFKESFYPITDLVNPEFANYSYISLLFKDENGVLQDPLPDFKYEEDREYIRKLNLVRYFLFEQLGMEFDRILIDVSW